MNKEELINMIDEIIFDYEVTGGIMPNTLDKAKRLINYSHPKETPKVSTNKANGSLCDYDHHYDSIDVHGYCLHCKKSK